MNGLRGVAAFFVAAFHAHAFFGKQIVPGGYLAVDVFFVLSGFVIAHAYDAKLRADLSPGRFFALRLKRFYPLYALGLIFAASWMALELSISLPAVLTVGQLGVATGVGLVFLPAPITPALYPLNPPAWSLFFELIVNLGYAALFPFLRIRTLAGIAALSWVTLVVALTHGHYPSADGGAGFTAAHIGLLRAIFSFSVGAVLYRSREKLPQLRVHPALLIAGVAGLLLLSVPNRLAFDLMAITFAFPFGIALIANSRAQAFDGFFRELGALSFPLYAIHLPLIEVGLATKDFVPLPPAVLGMAWLAIAVLCALAAHHWFDKPTQKLLKQWSSQRTAGI